MTTPRVADFFEHDTDENNQPLPTTWERQVLNYLAVVIMAGFLCVNAAVSALLEIDTRSE